MKTKIRKMFSLLLCCIMVLGIFPVTVSAATADDTPQPFSFDVDKTVVKGGDADPGEETFTFELEYGTIEENEQYLMVFTPDDNVTLEDCGIAFTNCTITTNGVGEETFSLGGTIDPTKVDAAHHWQDFTGNDSVPKQGIVLRLTERNDGKAGWTYSGVERYLTITVKGNEISTDVGILGNDVYDNNFENIYTAYSFTVKKTDADGNPLAGATFSLTGTGDFDGMVFDTVSGADGIAAFNVPEGNYILFEKTAPDGYVKADEAYAIAVRNDIDHTALDWGGEPGVYVYNEDEPDYSNFKYVKYQQVTFVNEAIVVTVPTYQFTVKKTDADGNPLAGATFSLTGTGNSIGKDFEAVSGTDGIATFDVPEGFYTLAEKTAPAGYIKSDKTYGIAIWEGVVHFYNENVENDNDRYSDYQQVTFVNEKIVIPTNPSNPHKTNPNQFTVKKTDADGNPLAGATFSLTGTGNSIGKDFEAVSGTDGIATFDIPEGFYTLAEKTAPAGYIKSDKTYGIAIWEGVVHFYNENAENDNDRYSDYQQVTFVNEKIVIPTNPSNPDKTNPNTGALDDVPQTGDNSNMILWIVLLLVSGFGVTGAVVYSKRKKYAK